MKSRLDPSQMFIKHGLSRWRFTETCSTLSVSLMVLTRSCLTTVNAFHVDRKSTISSLLSWHFKGSAIALHYCIATEMHVVSIFKLGQYLINKVISH